MSREAKIYLFKDRKDYIKKITDDNIVNITGEKGSGKSYFGNLKDENTDCNVIHLDLIFVPEGNNNHEFSEEIRNILINKFGNDLDSNIYFEPDYYPTMIEYLKSKSKVTFIEGGSIANIYNISSIRGTVIVKRTGVLKCLYRTIKRDYNNKYFMKKETELHGKFARIIRLYKVIKRRKKILKSYHNIERFISSLEKAKAK